MLPEAEPYEPPAIESREQFGPVFGETQASVPPPK